MWALVSARVISGLRIRFTPPASARSDLPPPQALAGQVHRHQRRRAGRVQRQARPVEIQEIGQPIGQNGMTAAGARKDVHVAEVFGLQQGVVVADHADVDAGPGLGELAGGQSARLPRLPRRPPAGGGAAGRRAPPRAARCRRTRRRTRRPWRGIRPSACSSCPARRGPDRSSRRCSSGRRALRGWRRTPSHSSRQKASRVVRAAGKPAAHADHGDRLGLRALAGRQLGLRLLEQVESRSAAE